MSSIFFLLLLFINLSLKVFSSAVLLFLFEGFPVMPPDAETWVYLILLSICGCIAQTAFNYGGQMIDATKTSVFRSTDVAFVLLWQITLLHQIPSVWSLVGIFLVCSCTIMMGFAKSRNQTKSTPNLDDEPVPIQNEDDNNPIPNLNDAIPNDPNFVDEPALNVDPTVNLIINGEANCK